MDNAFAEQLAMQMKKEHYEKAQRAQDGSGYFSAIGLARELSNIAPPPSAPGILAMTENAHTAFERLSNALTDLYGRLNPLIEPYPEKACAAGTANQISEASAVMALRMLVERIDTKTDEIRRLCDALRV